jgi:branched-chain amino acid transport system permease protein
MAELQESAVNLPKDAGAASPARYVLTIGNPVSRGAMVAFALLVVVLAFAPTFVSRSTVQDLILIFLLVCLAQCWNLLAGYAGLISVGQQAFVGLGGYTLFAFIITLGIDPLISVLISAVIVAILSIPVGLIVFRMQGAYFAVVTWVVAEVFRLLSSQWKVLGGGTGTSLPRSASTDVIGLEFVATLFDVRNAAAREIIIYWMALAAVVLIIAIAYLLLRSRLGLALSAIRDGEVAAESIGVDINRTKFIVYVFAAFGAGLVGALYFLQASRISPDAAFSLLDWTAYVIFIVVIGGIGTIEGPIIGAIIFVVLRALLAGYGPWYLILLGVLGIAVMLIAPKGLWGVFSQWSKIELYPTRRKLERRDD